MIDDRAALLHILEAIQRIDDYMAQASQNFLEDPKTQDAVIRNLTVVGEAVKKLSTELRDAHPDIPWKKIAGMRDNLVHAYFGIDLPLVYDTVRFDLPQLRTKMEEILGDER